MSDPGLAAKPDCPSCGGSGFAVVRAGAITVAMGACVCVGGNVRANKDERSRAPDDEGKP